MSRNAKAALQALTSGLDTLNQLTGEARQGNHVAAVAIIDLANTATRAVHNLWYEAGADSRDSLANNKEASRLASELTLRRKCIRQHVNRYQYFPTLDSFAVGALRKEGARRFEVRQTEILRELRFGPLKKKGRKTAGWGMFHLVFEEIEPAFWRIKTSQTPLAKRSPLETAISRLPELSRANAQKWVTVAMAWIVANRFQELSTAGSRLYRLSDAENALGKQQKRKVAALNRKEDRIAKGTAGADANFDKKAELERIWQMTPSKKLLVSGLKREMKDWLERNLA